MIDIGSTNLRTGTIRDLDWVTQLRSIGWRVRRSWPRARDHLLLEVIGDDASPTAGQWFADRDRAGSVAARTPGSRLVDHVVLQPAGADRKLIRLAELVARPGHRLIAHRPERRAVVAGPGGYLKMVRPDRLPGLLDRARTAERLDLGAPAVLDADADLGTVTTAPLPGTPLTDLLASGDTRACTRVGARLARLHQAAVPSGLPDHGPVQELQVLDRWTRLADQYDLRVGQHATPRLPETQQRSLIHRDLHDGQILVDAGGIGVLDFDLMAVGDPALDLANFLAQLELRGSQGRLPDPSAAIGATLDGYRPSGAVLAALPGYLAAARIRLRAVYAFRDPEFPS